MKLGKLAIGILTVAALGCSTLQVNTDYSPGTDFSKYKSFSLQKGEAGKYQIEVDRLMKAIESAISARGLKGVPEGGDLSVVVHVTLGKDTQLNTTGYGGYGGYRWGGGMQTTTVQEIPTGTLVVDLVDAATKTAVWRGTAKDQLSTTATPEEKTKYVNDVATQLFANYPPKACLLYTSPSPRD